jgi:hypothetical protein
MVLFISDLQHSPFPQKAETSQVRDQGAYGMFAQQSEPSVLRNGLQDTLRSTAIYIRHGAVPVPYSGFSILL